MVSLWSVFGAVCPLFEWGQIKAVGRDADGLVEKSILKIESEIDA